MLKVAFFIVVAQVLLSKFILARPASNVGTLAANVLDTTCQAAAPIASGDRCCQSSRAVCLDAGFPIVNSRRGLHAGDLSFTLHSAHSRTAAAKRRSAVGGWRLLPSGSGNCPVDEREEVGRVGPHLMRTCRIHALRPRDMAVPLSKAAVSWGQAAAPIAGGRDADISDTGIAIARPPADC